MRLLMALLVSLAVCAFGASPVMADPFGSAPHAVPTFGKDNTQLEKILALQYQMQLLKRLIEREKLANNMMQASIDVGVTNPVTPKPDRALCAQVPANIPCATAFDDLYPDFSVKPAKAIVPQLVAIDPPKLDVAAPVETVKQVVTEIAGQQLFWMDITCLEEKCSALISADPADPATRYRVSIGEKLPDGGVISGISANGVTLKRGTKEIKLDPAPADPSKSV